MIIGIIGLLLFLLPTAYVVGYFLLCDIDNGAVCYRTYAREWLAEVYGPAANLESLVTGKRVETAYWSFSDE